MKEYTVCALVAAAVVVLIDQLLHTRILRRRLFWVFLAVMFCFMFAVNGYLTWRPIVLYGDEHYLGIRLFTIPVEDFVYGFSLIAASVMMWEYFTGREKPGMSSTEPG